MTKTIISTTQAPAAVGPYSQAVKAGNFLYISGQIPINPETGVLVEGGIKDQTHQVLRNIRAICEEAGVGLGHVVKTTLYLRDLSLFKDVNETYAEYFSKTPPARATVGVSALPLNASIEIDAVAFIS